MKPKNTLLRIAAAVAWSIVGFIALIIILVVAATWWLTPERLTAIVNREVSENLRADLKASNIRFTLWSTWPHLCIEADSARLTSRVFDDVPASIKRRLPANADYIGSTGEIKGGINLLDLIHGSIHLTDVEVKDLDINLLDVNDTLSNYLILPPDSFKSSIPYFEANKLKLITPKSISYTSLADGAKGKISLHALSLIKQKNEDTYRMQLTGNIDIRVRDLEILRNFPVELDGNILLAFHPFRLSTDNYAVTLGNVKGNMDMNVQLGDEMRLNSFSYRLANFNLKDLLSQIPGIRLPVVESIDAPITVNASARLTSPWRFSSTELPSAEVDLSVADGFITYTTSSGRRYRIEHRGAGGSLIFNGLNPYASYFRIHPFTLSGEGAEMSVAAVITRLLGSPLLKMNVGVNAMLGTLTSNFPEIKESGIDNLKGNLGAGITIDCNISPLSTFSEGIRDRTAVSMIDSIVVKGNARLNNFSARMLSENFTAAGNNIDVTFSGDARAAGSHLNVGTLLASVSSGSMHAGIDKNYFDISGMRLDLKATPSATPIRTSDYVIPARWKKDRRSLDFARHSPEYIQADVPDNIKKLMAGWHTYSHLRLNKAVVKSDYFPARTVIANLDMEGSFDSIAIKSLYLRSRSTAMKMKGRVRNLRQFLNSSTPAPLYVDMDVSLDTIQFNQLAATYERGQKLTKGMAYVPAPDTVSYADTVSVLIPRNLICNVRASALQTQYMDLHFYDLGAEVKLADGNASVDNLKISADFGHAYLDLDYNTSDIQRIGINASFGVLDVDVVRFFQNFHTLLLMMPQMSNLEGDISAEGKVSLLAFPNMYVNVPSLSGDVHVEGDGLTVHQNHFIRHITKMLLIKNGGDLHIADMKVHASVHDNLLELYPFRFQLEDYRLRMLGLNNFDGDLYYHIEVEEWPLRVPFGVNIEGKFSHPKLRVGGEKWNTKKGEEITRNIEELHMINIIAEAKKYLKEFVHKAAESDEKPVVK